MVNKKITCITLKELILIIFSNSQRHNIIFLSIYLNSFNKKICTLGCRNKYNLPDTPLSKAITLRPLPCPTTK